MFLDSLCRWRQLAEPSLSRPPVALKVVWHVLLEALTLAMWEVLPLADNITNSREIKVREYCSNLTFDNDEVYNFFKSVIVYYLQF